MFKRLVIAVFMIMFVSGTAMAGAIATGECPADAPTDCVKAFTLDDMGTFLEDGSWQWNADFRAVHEGQLECTPEFGADCENGITIPIDDFAPYKYTVPVSIDNVRVDRRKYADAGDPNANENVFNHTRFVFNVHGESVMVNLPFLYQDANSVASGNGLLMVPKSDDEGNAWIQRFEYTESELPAPAVTSTEWNGNFGSPYINERTEYLYMLNYNTGMRDWQHNGWYEEISPMHHYRFTEEIESTGPQTFTINLSNGESYNTTINVDNVEPMPLIKAHTSYTQTAYTKSGKVVKGLTGIEVEVENIKIREVPDRSGENGLVIQWAEPDAALWGNTNWPYDSTFMLRVYVGQWSEDLKKEVYLWIDCPVQTGTVTVPSEHYNWLKDKVVEEGLPTDSLEMFILYRTTNGKMHLDDPSYHNRGLSSIVSFEATF